SCRRNHRGPALARGQNPRFGGVDRGVCRCGTGRHGVTRRLLGLVSVAPFSQPGLPVLQRDLSVAVRAGGEFIRCPVVAAWLGGVAVLSLGFFPASAPRRRACAARLADSGTVRRGAAGCAVARADEGAGCCRTPTTPPLLALLSWQPRPSLHALADHVSHPALRDGLGSDGCAGLRDDRG